jgi:23S rRNA pseudouridine1911/1915/1917 synthase
MTGGSTRWVVGQKDPRTVGALVLRAGGDARPVAEGRVFVGRRRVRKDDEKLDVGDEVTIAAPRAAPSDVVILAREGDLVAVDKPAGVPTIADHGGAAYSLVSAVAHKLGVPAERVHPTSRLDREVSGVVLFALSKEAAAHLKRARDEGRYERRYVALATDAPEPARGTWDAPIGRASNPRHRAAFGRDGANAETRYAVIASVPSAALLALAPVTGRTHQLRVHASHAGAPLLGDRTYGGPASVTLASGRVIGVRRIALHAARVVVPRQAGSPLAVLSPVPEDLAEVWNALGGEPSAWQAAIEEGM